MIQCRAPRDRQQPIRYWTSDINTVEMAMGLDECLLREVLGILALARHLQEKMKYPPLMVAYDLFKRPGVTRDRRPHDLGVGGESILRLRQGLSGARCGRERHHCYFFPGAGDFGSRTLTANLALPSGSFT